MMKLKCFNKTLYTEAIDNIIVGREILLEQRTRRIVRFVMKNRSDINNLICMANYFSIFKLKRALYPTGSPLPLLSSYANETDLFSFIILFVKD